MLLLRLNVVAITPNCCCRYFSLLLLFAAWFLELMLFVLLMIVSAATSVYGCFRCLYLIPPEELPLGCLPAREFFYLEESPCGEFHLELFVAAAYAICLVWYWCLMFIFDSPRRVATRRLASQRVVLPRRISLQIIPPGAFLLTTISPWRVP